MSEVLKQVHARTRILDQHPVAGVLVGEPDHLAPQLGIFEPATENVEQVDVVPVSAPSGAKAGS